MAGFQFLHYPFLKPFSPVVHNRIRPPIIIIGMHRSGTSILTRVLEELGLFVGWKKDCNHESLFFLRLNEWLLWQAGASWDNPAPFRFFLHQRQLTALSTKYLRVILTSPRVASYLGWRKHFRYRSVFNLDIPWGWKDPRNTITLPVWLEIFPEAKILYIYRNGVDVANSLENRSEKELIDFGEWMRKNKWTHRILHRGFPKIANSVRCLSLREGFKIWETYTCDADKYIEALPPDRAMSIRYEDFVKNTVTVLQSVCPFVGITPRVEEVIRVQCKVNQGRSEVYNPLQSRKDFYESIKDSPQMRNYHY